MKAPFVVLGLPRSQTCWLSHWLAYGGRQVGHDTLVECDHVEDFLGPLRSGALAGTCETGAMVGWKVLMQELPTARILLVRRPVPEVAASLARFGIECEAELWERSHVLDLISWIPGVRCFAFADLGDEGIARQVWEHCLPEVAWDGGWWEHWSGLNIQIDMKRRLERLAERAGVLAGLKAEVGLASSKIKGTKFCAILQ